MLKPVNFQSLLKLWSSSRSLQGLLSSISWSSSNLTVASNLKREGGGNFTHEAVFKNYSPELKFIYFNNKQKIISHT